MTRMCGKVLTLGLILPRLIRGYGQAGFPHGRSHYALIWQSCNSNGAAILWPVRLRWWLVVMVWMHGYRAPNVRIM